MEEKNDVSPEMETELMVVGFLTAVEIWCRLYNDPTLDHEAVLVEMANEIMDRRLDQGSKLTRPEIDAYMALGVLVKVDESLLHRFKKAAKAESN